MKKRFIIVFALCVTLFSPNTFAQAPSLPFSFKTVNGKGVCGTAAEIRVYFEVLPAQLPTIEQIRSEQRDVTGIVIGNIDASEFDKKGYVSYCIISTDILPAGKLWIRFHYDNPEIDYWLTETKAKKN